MDLIFRNSDSPWLPISCACVDRAEYSFCEFPGSPHHKPGAGGNTTLSSFLKEGHLGRIGKNCSYSIELNGRRWTGSVYATPKSTTVPCGLLWIKNSWRKSDAGRISLPAAHKECKFPFMAVSQAGVEGRIFSPEIERWMKIQEQAPLEATCLSLHYKHWKPTFSFPFFISPQFIAFAYNNRQVPECFSAFPGRPLSIWNSPNSAIR